MSRLARPAARLSTGSSALARRIGARTAAWVARGRRHDLTGWRAALGSCVRILALAFGGYLLWRLVRAVPNLMWLITGAWMIAAWRAGKPTPTPAAHTPELDPEEEPPAAPQIDARTVLVHWLDRLTRGRAGIHLDELHQTLTRHPDLAYLKRAEMRAWLDRYYITVDRTLRVGAVAGRSGVSRATVEDLLQGLPPLPETSRTESPLHVSDQQSSTVESGVERGVESGVDPYFDDVARLFV